MTTTPTATTPGPDGAPRAKGRRLSRSARLGCVAVLVAGTGALMPAAEGASAEATALPAGCADSVTGKTVFSDGFEGTAPDFGFVKHRYDGTGATSSIRSATSPVLDGSGSGRFTVPGDGKSWRSEVANDALGYGAYRFSFSDFLPTDWEWSNYDTILAQWHGKPLADGSDTNPPIALSVRNSEWLLSVFHLENPDDTTPVRRSYSLGPVTRGVWNHWTFDIDWSTADHPGTLRVCRDGVQLVDDSGENNYHQPAEPYFKLGVYRPSWNPAKGRDYPVGVSVVDVYDDSVSVTGLG
ncbi:polysaccharide lyase [Streptomyces sp. NPDC088730]|uniref:polysaccharide lyase n=1 Tax=Streptomyces sp. NPDC088730 TaxID=3365877 RepID=UPI00380F2313